MTFRQAARKPEAFEIGWGDRYAVSPWTEEKTEGIAQFLLGTGTQSFTELKECADGTLESARHYVTRARKYMEGKSGADLGYSASSLVCDTATSDLVAVCLCCGSSLYFIEVHPDYQRQGIATNMLKRALTVCAEHGVVQFDLWRNDDSIGVPVYERLGFVLTGETE